MEPVTIQGSRANLKFFLLLDPCGSRPRPPSLSSRPSEDRWLRVHNGTPSPGGKGYSPTAPRRSLPRRRTISSSRPDLRWHSPVPILGYTRLGFLPCGKCPGLGSSVPKARSWDCLHQNHHGRLLKMQAPRPQQRLVRKVWEGSFFPRGPHFEKHCSRDSHSSPGRGEKGRWETRKPRGRGTPIRPQARACNPGRPSHQRCRAISSDDAPAPGRAAHSAPRSSTRAGWAKTSGLTCDRPALGAAARRPGAQRGSKRLFGCSATRVTQLPCGAPVRPGPAAQQEEGKPRPGHAPSPGTAPPLERQVHRRDLPIRAPPLWRTGKADQCQGIEMYCTWVCPFG